MAAALIELERVSKAFGPTPALRDVSFDVRAGEVHAVVGENGAGKSTLIKILSGVYSDYSGELRINGRSTRLRGPADAAARGVATIHQELSLVPALSVADNLLLGSDDGALFGVLSRRRRRERVRRMLDAAGLAVDPEVAVENVPLSVRQLLEIEKALARRAEVVIMDEPTSALTDAEADVLLERVAALKARGTGVVYVSHRLDEIQRVADRVSVLRDGVRVATTPRAELSIAGLVQTMLGRSLDAVTPPEPVARGPSVLAVRGLCSRDPRRPGRRILSDVSFDLKAGEIVGLAGLRGSGKSELLHALFGSFGAAEGEISLGGAQHRVLSPEHSLESGVALLASDRRDSVLFELSARANVSLSTLARFTHAGWIRTDREAEDVAAQAAEVSFDPERLPEAARRLSGGNQQKVALARCLMARPRVLLLDEPTRGIDLGAKADIYAVIRELAGRGVAILLIASELEELLSLSHRVLVLDRGSIATCLEGPELTRERILAAEMGRGAAS